MYDLVIKDATILDGTGDARYDANIAIKNGIIRKIHQKPITDAQRIIDAGGRYVTPGFIDAVNHSDTHVTLLTQPSQDSMVRQGVTTIVGGQCGASLAPLIGVRAIQSIQKWGNINALNINWQTMGEYFSYLDSLNLGLNYASLIGYGTLRRGLLHDQYRALSDQELQVMLQQVKNALDQGALGLSQGLAYGHLRMATFDELVEVGRMVGKKGKTQTLHMRNDGQVVIESIDEAIALARQGRVATHIAHLKILGKKNWKYFDEVASRLDHALEEGLKISFSVFPYTANNSVMYLLLPYWVAEGGKKAMLEKLRDPEVKAKVVKDMKANNYDYNKIFISFSPMDQSSVGKSIVEIAKNQGVGIEEALVNVVIASQAQTSVITHAIHPDHMRYLAMHPASIITSDGVGYNDEFTRSSNYVHPRCYGAFPHFLRMVVDREIPLTLEQAVAKISGKPAQVYGLRKRGVIREGFAADLNLVNTSSIAGQASFENPLVYPKGIEWVIINGRVSIEQEEYIDATNGKVLTQ
jgi:N-acyl-D-amino-acid deacylase